MAGTTNSRKARMPWSDGERRTLRELHAEGADDASIAARLGRSIGAVAEWRRKLRLTSNNPRAVRRGASAPWTEKEDALLRRLFDQGLSDDELAPQFGRSPNACRLRRHMIGVVDEKFANNRPDKLAPRTREPLVRYRMRVAIAQHDPVIGREERIARARELNEQRRLEAFRRQFGRDPSV